MLSRAYHMSLIPDFLISVDWVSMRADVLDGTEVYFAIVKA